MSLSSWTTERQAVACRRAHRAIRRMFLAGLRCQLTKSGRFADPLGLPWHRAVGLVHGQARRCPIDGRRVEALAMTCYWKAFRWRTVIGQCPCCGTMFYTRPTFTPDDYLGREIGERIRQEFLRTMGQPSPCQPPGSPS
jgi:hypothetical protein